jgi:hypothetical protein
VPHARRRLTRPTPTLPLKGRGLLAAVFFTALPITPAAARETVEASAPRALAVTVYRDPHRGRDQAMNRNWPQGFAMISETRQVTLPPGESTIRFDGVAEGMVAVSAIVTGLPGGTIEKNRNADLLSPAALVDGTLGNRVTVTRTNPATGAETSESAVVRTRADGGLVLQTREGFEAVRCSGLPERLTFDRVPAGLSAKPVFSIDTRDPAGGTYTVTLTYLAWGFDWQAHYVATLEPGRGAKRELSLLSWLTLLNDNGQSFPDAELMAIAGTLNVTSDYRALADPPRGEPLRLVCYPLGSTATGSPIGGPYPPPPPPPPPPMAAPQAIIVTGSRARRDMMESKAAVIAAEEQLGDLKLYRVPVPVTVNAKGLKQIAFLQRDSVQGELVHVGGCTPDTVADEARPFAVELHTVNDRRHGLGAALPMGGLTVFEPTPRGELLLGEDTLRDQAEGEKVEIALTESRQAFLTCERIAGREDGEDGPVRLRAVLTNAGGRRITVRFELGPAQAWTVAGPRKARLEDGQRVLELTVPARGSRTLEWTVTPA